MDENELLADTNRLLREYMEQQRIAKEETDRMISQPVPSPTAGDFEDRMKARLAEKGFSDSEIAGPGGDWEARSQTAIRKSQDSLETIRAKHEEYQAAILTELRSQGDLLRQIAEKLGS